MPSSSCGIANAKRAVPDWLSIPTKPMARPINSAVIPRNADAPSTAETVMNASYQPLARPIFIYVAEKSLTRPEVKNFLRYYLEHGARLSKEVKYVPLPESAYKVSWQHVEKNKFGTVFGGTAEVGVTIDELLRREAKL